MPAQPLVSRHHRGRRHSFTPPHHHAPSGMEEKDKKEHVGTGDLQHAFRIWVFKNAVVVVVFFKKPARLVCE